MVDLLPCPFCGGLNVYVDYNDFEDFCVSCDDCTASGPVVALGPIKREDDALREAAKVKAIELWNNRAAMHIKFTAAETAYTAINGELLELEQEPASPIDPAAVFVKLPPAPLTPKMQRLA